MVIEEKLGEKIHKTEKKLRELSLHIQRLNGEYQQCLEELNSTPEQLKNFAEDPDNFSESIWKQLQEEKKELDENLEKELNNVVDANKTKKTLSEKSKVQPHWLFIR